VLHLLAAELPSVGRHYGDVACHKHVNLGRKILVSLAIWYSLGVLIDYHLVIDSSPTRRYNNLDLSFTFRKVEYLALLCRLLV
jgi:hypothetical protein